MQVEKYIENTVDLKTGQSYGAILGLSPSRGARSPLLWREAFNALSIDAAFHPFDVAPENLENIVVALKSDSRFIGGAVAVPYKERLLPLLDEIEFEAQNIGAVNALHRTPDGKLAGANTDGAAALESLTDVVGSIDGKNVLLLGLGGAGKAVATYVAGAGASLSVWNKTTQKAKAFAGRMEASNFSIKALENLSPATLRNTDILINCTSVGFSPDSSQSSDLPLPKAYIAGMECGFVFDIIYQPEQTALLKAAADQGLKTLNGKPMNLGQAVIAFHKAFPNTARDDIEAAMERV